MRINFFFTRWIGEAHIGIYFDWTNSQTGGYELGISFGYIIIGLKVRLLNKARGALIDD